MIEPGACRDIQLAPAQDAIGIAAPVLLTCPDKALIQAGGGPIIGVPKTSDR